MQRIGIDARRLEAAIHLTGVLDCEENGETIQNRIYNRGLEQAVTDLNERWGMRLSAGAYAIYSPSRDRYWSEDHGWLVDQNAANGYTESDLQHLKAHKICGAPDALFLRRVLKADALAA